MGGGWAAWEWREGGRGGGGGREEWEGEGEGRVVVGRWESGGGERRGRWGGRMGDASSQGANVWTYYKLVPCLVIPYLLLLCMATYPLSSYTPLMEAAREGHEDVVQLLVDHGANVNTQTEETQETALTLSCCGGFLEVTQFLIEHGV